MQPEFSGTIWLVCNVLSYVFSHLLPLSYAGWIPVRLRGWQGLGNPSCNNTGVHEQGDEDGTVKQPQHLKVPVQSGSSPVSPILGLAVDRTAAGLLQCHQLQ